MTPKILVRRPMEYDSVVLTGDDLCRNTKTTFFMKIYSHFGILGMITDVHELTH